MKKIIILLAVVALLGSCVTKKKCESKFPCDRSSDSVWITHYRETLEDTTIYLTDSSWAKLYFECSEDGELLMKRMEEYKGKYLSKPVIIYKDKIVTIECKLDSAAILIFYKNKFLQEYSLL